jgi:plastocyanin
MVDLVRNQCAMPIRCAIFWVLLSTAPIIAARGEDTSAVGKTAFGAIEGNVIYRADSKRPWRYSRYYIKDAKSGELAEAVVALRGKKLDKASGHASATITIDQKNFQFLPETVAIRQGDSIAFTNGDQATHNIRSSGDIADFNVTIPAGADGYLVRFDRSGGIRRPAEVGCAFHSNMRAWVFVFDHPFYQITKADGQFRFAEVPPGQYELEMVHPAGGISWRQNVTVKAGETLRADIRVSPADMK